MRQGLDLRDIETATKIRTKYLKALEDERFDQLPAETYIRGFLRTFSEHLGLDGQLYVDEYNSRYATEEDVHGAPIRPRRTVPRTPRRRRNRDGGMVLAALGAIAIVTALVIAAWRFGGGSDQQAGIPGLDPAETRSTPAAPPPPAAAARTRVVLRAIENSFVEAHANAQTGRQLYSGTLEKGQSKLFQARRVWLNIGIPQNVRVTVNGKPVRLLERRKPTIYLVTPTGLTPASPTT